MKVCPSSESVFNSETPEQFAAQKRLLTLIKKLIVIFSHNR